MKTTYETFRYVQGVLTLFKAAPTLEIESNYTLDNERNLKNGFFITEAAFKACPCIAAEELFDFLKEKFGYNIFELNQGFYKSFKTVADSTPQKILVNKLLHYMSTYGMEELGLFDRELVYIPNDALELPADATPLKVTVINAITTDDIKARVLKLIQSGAALSEETLDALADVVKFLSIEIDVDDVPNKEFAVRLCDLLNVLPADPVKFLRYMIYKATGSTLLIKDRRTIDGIKNGKFDDQLFARYIERNGLGRLASVFHRFKPLWLAFKPHSDYMRATINKMRKLADRYHKPTPPKFLEQLTAADAIDFDRLKQELANVTAYRKVSLANAILYRQATPESIVYNIRNGSAFADDYHGGLHFDASKVLDVLIDSIAEDIAPNVGGKKIYIPERFTYAAPVSEKKFIGNIPSGSSYTFDKNSVVVGVHWFNILVDGREMRVDLDLHLNSPKRDIGWHNDFDEENFIDTKELKVIFSGDMTDAPIDRGGATEAFFVGETVTDELMMINLNNYTYDQKNNSVPFKLILGDVTQDSINRQYLINSHEVAFCVPNEILAGQMFIGFLASDESGAKKFYFSTGNTGTKIVARSDELTNKVIAAMNSSFESSLGLKVLLERAGAIFVSDAADSDINLDPAAVTKDILLGLFAK
ncbi:MAG: hypothetical protein IKI76_11200 [Selenomonadaceae bacterium]|nr:hypothetical protein [Selenomonadaceae bacterium]